jgi:RNA polymerase sigma-70 factor (subfamily 1)
VTGSRSDVTESLIAAAQNGDPGAVDRLVNEHLHAIRAYVRLNVDEMLRARESCSDMVQSVCREVLTDLGGFRYRGEKSFHSWLFVMVLNKIRDRQRYFLADKRDPRREASPPDLSASAAGLATLYASVASPSQVAMAHEQLERIECAFDQMPAKYRTVLTMSRLMGMSASEIAEETDQTCTAVSTQLARGLVMLSRILGTS